MFGSRVRAPRPVLLIIVYGVFLVIVGLTATAETLLVSLHVSTASLEATVGSDAATIRTVANGFLEESDLSGTPTADRTAAVEATLGALLHRGELLRIDVRKTDGTILFSTDATARGQTAGRSSGFERAVGVGSVPAVDAAILDGSQPLEAPGGPLPSDQLVRGYFPLVAADGTTQAVIAMFRDAAPLFAKLNDMRAQVVLVMVSASVIVAVMLFLIFRAAQRRISSQTAQLVDSTRRDPLTGLLNHGALVGELAIAIEDARASGRTIGIALVDVDNFRPLNDTYGHPAGDAALLRVAARLAAAIPETATVGRSGPDEFLIVAAGLDLARLTELVDSVRAGLAEESLQFDTSEHLPITLSAGVAVFPDHATSVTELLSLVAVALGEAKASGGDAVRSVVAKVDRDDQRRFDVLQGLVFAVDTKDRYTKRHSEDVARYAAFLADWLELDGGFVAAIRTAGLLHDIGKIGIPDSVLRKPGRLTSDEYEIVKQHVALGDSIVRDVDQVEIVRAGIRHHHERWDGRGYLHALRGEDIPLVARILAVGDAFSAMTTTRPYRKALSVEEALVRLADAAGTQLDERLVAAFIEGIETAADAPRPGDGAAQPIWVPRREVA